MARTIFIGDVHGCLDELKDLLSEIDPSPRDRVILLGDLINKGPDSEGAVAFVIRKGYDCLMGNHEWGLLKGEGKSKTWKSLSRELGKAGMAWVSVRPKYIDEKTFTAVHAGLRPGVSLEEQAVADLLTLRNIPGEKGEGKLPWHHRYRGKKPVFYGHWARQGLNLTKQTVGLDTGCVYGGKLSAYVLEENRLFQVNARRVYQAVDAG